MEAIFEDPVTFEVMRDAVVSSCGHSFSMASISQWLSNHDSCPICKHTLKLDECTPNYALRNAIEQVSFCAIFIHKHRLIRKYSMLVQQVLLYLKLLLLLVPLAVPLLYVPAV